MLPIWPLIVVLTAVTVSCAEAPPGLESNHAHHACIHDSKEMQGVVTRLQAQFPDGLPVSYASRGGAAADVSASPLRISISTAPLDDATRYCTSAGQSVPDMKGGTTTCTADDILTQQKRDVLVNNIVPAAVRALGALLAISAPVSSPIIVPATTCGGLFPIPASHSSSGVADADFVLYVSASPTSSTTLAFAAACAADASGRQIIGYANFGPAHLGVWGTSETDDITRFRTATHELLHALGFSYSIFQSRGLTAARDGVRGKTVTVFTGANTVAVAKKFYGCDTLTGVELEDEGGDGSRLSHWERRILRDELMAASGGVALSAFTQAAMMDLGYYVLPANQTTNGVSVVNAMPSFGRGAGCSFLTERCNAPAVQYGTVAVSASETVSTKNFCFDATDREACVNDYSAIGYCAVLQYSGDLPTYFQYFTSASIGGPTFLDGCPYVTSYSNRVCTDTRTATNDETALGFTFGRSSRCFQAKGFAQNGRTTSSSLAGRCFESRCFPTAASSPQLQLRVASGEWVTCPSGGAVLDTIPGFSGSITCPSSITDFCNKFTATDTATVAALGGAMIQDSAPGSGAEQVSQSAGAERWIEGTLKLSGTLWSSLAETGNVNSSLLAALQLDVAGVAGVAASNVRIDWETSVVTTTSFSIRYTLYDETTQINGIAGRLAAGSGASSNSWLRETLRMYQQSGETTSARIGVSSEDASTYLISGDAQYVTVVGRLIAGLGVPAVVGICIGVFAFAVIAVVLICCCWKHGYCCCNAWDDDDDVQPSHVTKVQSVNHFARY